MEKEHILDEIRRTALENGGKPLGIARFFKETGIRQENWYGRYWIRWSEALREAGFSPNRLQTSFDSEFLLRRYLDLARELGHQPVQGELIRKRRQDPTFPHHRVFRRFGSLRDLPAKALEYCRAHSGFDDVAGLLTATASGATATVTSKAHQAAVQGAVYLLKSGRFYKIGRTNAVGRRERELAIQLPEKARTVHVIRTDDPVGIEAYWHNRFASKRRHGEWFELDAGEVSAFRRRKFM